MSLAHHTKRCGLGSWALRANIGSYFRLSRTCNSDRRDFPQADFMGAWIQFCESGVVRQVSSGRFGGRILAFRYLNQKPRRTLRLRPVATARIEIAAASGHHAQSTLTADCEKRCF